MKTNHYLNIAAGFVLLLATSTRVTAQYDAETYYAKAKVPVVTLEAPHRSTTEAPVAKKSNTISSLSINSAEDFALFERNINLRARVIHDALLMYPNLKYTPSYENGEIVAFMVTGVPDSSIANRLAVCLMQLEMLGNTVRSMDTAYLPAIADDKLARVGKQEASN